MIIEGLGEHFGFIDETRHPDLGDLSRTSAQLLLEAILIDVGDIGPDRLNPYPVRRRALLFVASSP